MIGCSLCHVPFICDSPPPGFERTHILGGPGLRAEQDSIEKLIFVFPILQVLQDFRGAFHAPHIFCVEDTAAEMSKRDFSNRPLRLR